eukprot:jgi/Botrbrau1/4042/Bobra.152_3s0003.1
MMVGGGGWGCRLAVERGEAPTIVQPALEKMVSAYMDIVLVASHKSWRVMNRVYTVLHMLNPPTALFHPLIVVAALGVLIRKALSFLPGFGLFKQFTRDRSEVPLNVNA